MNKGLEALEKLGNIDVVYNRNGIEGCYSIKDTDEFEIIENSLKKLERWESFKISEEEAQWLVTLISNSESQLNKLKALEIIEKKGLSLLHKILIISSKSYEEYRQEFQLVKSREFKNEYIYTQEEFDLLKEVLL